MSRGRLVFGLLALMVLPGWGLLGQAQADKPAPGGLQLEAILVWATHDDMPNDPKLKALEADLVKKLRATPYKWKNYFEVRRKSAAVQSKTKTALAMSEKCSLEIKNLGEDRVEVHLIGQGKQVTRQVESIANGQIMVLGGDAKNDTGWFIVVRQVAAKK